MAKPTFQQFAQAIMGAVPTNLSAKLYQQWIDNPEVLTQVLQQSLGTFPKPVPPVFPSYSVSIDYSKNVEQMNKDGNYNEVDNDITSAHFPSDEKGQAEVPIKLVGFYHGINSEDVIKEMGNMNPPLRPATLKELQSLGVAQPDLQRNKPIVALGSTWRASRGYGRVPYLYGLESHRGLGLLSLAGGWSSRWRFATVRK